MAKHHLPNFCRYSAVTLQDIAKTNTWATPPFRAVRVNAKLHTPGSLFWGGPKSLGFDPPAAMTGHWDTMRPCGGWDVLNWGRRIIGGVTAAHLMDSSIKRSFTEKNRLVTFFSVYWSGVYQIGDV
jgi:hypothetical protein